MSILLLFKVSVINDFIIEKIIYSQKTKIIELETQSNGVHGCSIVEDSWADTE